jgi:hypothetical protein
MTRKAYFCLIKSNDLKEDAIKLMKEANRMDLKSSKIWKISGQFYKEI